MVPAASLQPGTLWDLVRSRARHARACGALQPIETLQDQILDGGVRFLVRSVSGLAAKARAQQRPARDVRLPANPFLPYEADLFVAEVSDSHVALLNKFPVIELHLLIVTRDFEHQETLLNSRDFQALAACMTGVDGLGFYNGGTAAGASQTHKHLQLVPLPLSSDGPAVPIEPLLAGARTDAKPDQAPGLPFRHAFLRLDPALFTRPAQAGDELFAQYCSLCHAVGLGSALVDSRLQQSAPYNLLLTRDWMLLVPRTCEHADSISVNALGFAGSLFVKDQAQMGLIRQRGPMAVLQAVTHPA